MNRVRDLVRQGYTVEIGPHVDFSGYWATVFKNEGPKAATHDSFTWDGTGHGLSPEDALTGAIALANEVTHQTFTPADFKP